MAGGAYEIRLKGELRAPVLAAFEGFAAANRAPETVLSGPLADQHALHRVLRQVQELGLELISVRRLPEPTKSRKQRSSVERDRGSRSPAEASVTLRLAVRP